MSAAAKSPHALFTNALRLRNIVRTRNVKLIHARSRAPAWSALMAARMTRVPFVTTYHGIYNASNSVKRFYNSVMVRGDAVIANSQWTATHIAREYRLPLKRITVIPRGIDLARFDPGGIAPDHVTQLRRDWGVRPSDIVLFLPGRLTRWKGQAVLIEALAIVAKQGKLAGIRAVLAGDSQGRNAYESELRSAIASAGLSDDVLIPGHIRDMPTAYLAADIVISASTDPEAFGRVAAEASAMGRPVIAADHGGARETILANVSGFLIPPGDAQALAAAIERMIAAGPEGRAAMGQAGRAHIARNFTRERMCAETLALYRSLLSS